MAFSYACLTLQRVVIPALLVLTALFRPVGISFVYLLMFFISPFIPVATKHNFKGSVTAYLIILIALSSILLLCHIALQIITISLQIDTTVFGSCSFTELLLRHVGFIDFHHLKPIAIVEWLVPEVMVFGITLGVYLTVKKLAAGNVAPAGQLESGEADAAREALQNGAEGTVGAATVTMAVPGSDATTPTKPTNSTEEGPNFDGLIKFSPFFCLATLFFAAVLRPSVPGGFYFLIFLLCGSYWATFQSLQRGFAVVLRFVMVVLALHTLCIVSYQTPWMQQYMDPTSLPCRLLGLEPLATSSCENDIRIIVYNSDYKLDSYLNAIVLLFSYYVLALTTKNLIKPRNVTKPATAFGQQLENGSNKFNRQLSLMTQTSRGGSKKDSWNRTQRLNVSLRREHRPTNIEPTETTPLVRQSTRKSRQTTTSVSGGSALATPRNENEIPMDNLERRMSEDDAPASFMEQISYGFVSVGGFIYQNSYIFTNILMMAWSIVYHSWLTFALLLWANVLWMIPNQRKAMMRSSPFIVLYAELLLVAQYIYGMDLTNDELPSKVDVTGINLQQIGLDRPQEHGVQPCVPLIVKTSFLLMFWVTLRQFFKEKMERRSSTLSDMMAPVQLTINAAATGYDRQDGKKSSKFLKKAGGIIKNLLVRMWIWLLVLVIFLCAITGKQMTGFRICYMALFLFFLLVFQSSSKAWVKIMYGFWLFLIFYAMSILILIYTYQFDKFDQYWLEYLNISQTLQSDIGLERYKTKELFLHLVSPTIIVILTVIQVHYFHRRFIDALQAQQEQDGVSRHSQSIGEEAPKHRSSIAETKRVTAADVTDPAVLQESLRDLIRIFLRRVKKESKRLVRNFKNVFWRFLELHIMKAVYLTAFICSVSEVCVLHIVFVALCVIGVISSTPIQIFISRVISFIVTIIVLTKMIYQIAYLDHSQYDVHCKNNNETGNNAVWFGLEKASAATGGLMGLLKCYIIYMVMVTLHAVVSLRQFQMRSMQGTQNQPRPKVLFPQVVRAHAEKNLKGMIRYLLNYGYYKFGVEISLITLVATITYRQDIVAVTYVIWLCILLAIDRSKLSKIWIVFQYFLLISICLQYLLLVGLPPSLCLSYPWVDQSYSDSIQRWALLPGPLHYSHVSKLIFDFVLLLMVNRQKRVFWLESNSERNKEVYPGGNNKSVVNDIANLGVVPFENPTRDFLSHIRNYLDIFKNVLICGFYWITLALVFLAGTNISDLLALGYLVGSFVFLWEGSDFYLRPINNIIRRWNWLIYYNVLNMVIKISLQMAGCLFMDELGANCCWLVHVLGITCTTSAKNLDVPTDVPYLGEGCPPITTKSYLVWDAICFSFLILQARIFKSHYFCHIIIDTKANSILASRGAELIEELRQKQIHHRHQHEREVLRKIKRKMEKIRATQQKMLKPLEKPTHFDETGTVATLEVVATTATAPLARNSSFSSCQGSGYRTPDDDEDDDISSTSTHSNSSHTSNAPADSSNSNNSSDESHASDTESSEAQAQLLSNIDQDGGQILPVVEFDDFASEVQSVYTDVHSVSESGETDISPQRTAAVTRLRLPTVDIQVTPQVSVDVVPCGGPPLMQISDTNLKQTTPSSEVTTTMPLEGFLDVNRLSLGSAPNSDLMASLRKDSDDESNEEVFSPPAYAVNTPIMKTLLLPPMVGINAGGTSGSLSVNVSGGSSVISSNLTTSGATAAVAAIRHQRQSSVNAVSWSETISIKCTPKDDNEDDVEVSEDIPVTLRAKSLHRRHQSMGNASYSLDEQQQRRRSSNVSWARAESYMRSAARPHSWGPVEHGYPDPGSRVHKRKEIKLHPHAVRAGDYYMFDDMDEKFELDLIEDEVDFLEDQDQLTESEKKMSRRKTLIDVWKDIQGTDYRSRSYVRQRSYASAPGSRIGIKIDEDFADEPTEGGGVRTSTHSEPLEIAQRSTSDYFEKTDKVERVEKLEKVERYDDEPDEPDEPSTSQQAATLGESPPETKRKAGGDQAEVDYPEKDSDEDFNANPIVRLLEAFLVSLTVRLNRFSRNYRYVNKILAEEKKALKESHAIHNRLGRIGAAAMFTIMKKNMESDESEEAPLSSTRASIHALNNTNVSTQNNTNNLTATATPTTTTNTATTATTPQSPDQLPQPQDSQQQQQPHVVDIIEQPLDTIDARRVRQEPGSSNSLARVRKSDGLPEIRIKRPSLDCSHQGSGSLSKQWSYEKVDSATEYVFEEEDFASRDHNIIIEVLISAWYAILSNTDLICYIVVFINQVVNASIISLPLPIMVFLWGTLSLPRPTKTFWVTLIAYTQAIVLIKCIFQYKLIWANYINLPNQPLSPAKIFGVELNPNYASYDLLLLLVLFFHRFILKSQGLWKSEYTEGIMVSMSTDNRSLEGRGEDGDSGNANTNADNAHGSPSTHALMPAGSSMLPDQLDLQQSEQPSMDSQSDSSKYKYKTIHQLKGNSYFSSLRKFFYNLIHKMRLPADVYALMFLCDFVNFFVLLFGFTAFGSQQTENDSGVQTYLAENKVPIPFLIMLLVQFILIVIDRALYLRKSLFYKIIFHFFSVIGIHIWMFFIVPAVTERSFYSLAPPIIFYIIKCFYMLLSSYQIKCGYPKRILGNFLTKGFSMANMISFKVYMQIPFLYELRTILDWVCTDTTMTLFDWLKMEDIFSDIYFIKCSRVMETDFPAMRAQKKALYIKLLMGGTVILLIVISIWGPLCLFALGNAVGQSNVPYEVAVNIRVGPYDPIYATNNRESVFVFNDKYYTEMQNAFIKNKSAITFLSGYDAGDIAAVKLAGNSPSLWGISPPDKERLLSDLKNNVTLTARFTYSLTRIPPSKGLTGTVGAEVTVELNDTFSGRDAMINMLEGRSVTEMVEIPSLVPKFLKVLNSGEVFLVHTMTPINEFYRPLIIKIHAVNDTNNFWWEIRDYCNDSYYTNVLSKLPMASCESGIVMYTFNDKKFPSTFSFLTAGGIIGLYTTFVLLASRFLKSFIAGQNRKIMFEDLPYVDRVLQLCLDIYLVREALEFTLEEDLFAKLIFLYRSPETMIKWTRPKEEIVDDETDTESLRSRRPEHQ